jgi:hypothetical protein
MFVLVLTWLVFDLAVLTAAAAATTEDDAEEDIKLGGGGDEYSDVPLVHLVQFGLLADAAAAPPCDGCVCSADEGSGGFGWYDDEGGGGCGGWYEDKDSGGSGLYKDDATAVAAERDDEAVATVCVALFSVTSALVCLSSVWSLHRADMSGKSRLRLFSRNDTMSNTVVDPFGVVASMVVVVLVAAPLVVVVLVALLVVVVVVVAASTAVGRRGWTTAAGFWSPVTGGGGGGGRLRNSCTFGGTAGADVVAANKSS